MPLSALPRRPDSHFADAVRRGLGGAGQKRLPPEFFYDEVGSALFEVITLLPEYGLTRADRRLLARYSLEIVARAGGPSSVIELGSGSGAKTAHLLRAISHNGARPDYFAIDVSRSALERCRLELSGIASVTTIEAEFLDGVRQAMARVRPEQRVLVLFLGSTIGNFGRAASIEFLGRLRALLRPGGRLLMGADLVKPVEQLLPAYDDPAGVTAAFNLNLLARMNRELGARFDLRQFRHKVRWDAVESRVEMHLESMRAQSVWIEEAGCTARFEAGETLWTESSHKYTLGDLDRIAAASGFRAMESWVDEQWPFAECLWDRL